MDNMPNNLAMTYRINALNHASIVGKSVSFYTYVTDVHS